MKIKFIIFTLFVLFVCCTEDFSDLKLDLIDENDESEFPVTRAQPDIKYKELGWGIDMTGDYLSLNAVKAPVLDVNKFEADYETRIISKSSNRYSYQNDFYGSTATEYTKSISTELKIDYVKLEPGEKDAEFHNTINGNYSNKSSYGANYSFVGLDHCVEVGKAYFVENDVNVLRNYLDKGFIYSINNKSPKTVVEEYGTHVLIDITLGGKVSALFRSEVINTSKEIAAKAGFTYHVKRKFDIFSDTSYDSKLVQKNTKSHVVIKSTGGTKSVAYNMDLTSGALGSINLSSWDESVTFQNCNTIEVLKVIPIYEFVSDLNKKNQIKAAVNNYQNERKLQLLVPLYHVFNTKHYNDSYTTDERELNSLLSNKDISYVGVDCYVHSSQVPNTVPLYHFFNTKHYNDSYTTNYSDFGSSKDCNYIGIKGYVYTKKQTETVPFYHLWNKKHYNDSYTAVNSKLDSSVKNGCENLGIKAYVYPVK